MKIFCTRQAIPEHRKQNTRGPFSQSGQQDIFEEQKSMKKHGGETKLTISGAPYPGLHRRLSPSLRHELGLAGFTSTEKQIVEEKQYECV